LCSVAPPVPPTCGNFSANCTDCISGAFIAGLNCEWCPAGTGNLTEYLTTGSCVSADTCPVTKGLTVCAPPTVVSLNPCPDNCLSNGVCTDYNVSDTCFDGKMNNNETDVDCGGDICYPCKPGQPCKVDTDCFTDLCDNTTNTCGGSGYFAAGGPVSKKCVCKEGFSGSNCGIAPLVEVVDTVAIAGALSAVAIVGIVIGIALCCALAGGGTLAVYNKAAGDGVAPVWSNPLYKPEGFSGTNPLNKG